MEAEVISFKKGILSQSGLQVQGATDESRHKFYAYSEVVSSYSGRLPGQMVAEAGRVLGQSFEADPSMYYATAFSPELAPGAKPCSIAKAKATRHEQLVARICTDMVRYASRFCYLDLAVTAWGQVVGVAIWVAPHSHISTWEMITSGCWKWPFVMSPFVVARSLFYNAIVEEHHLQKMAQPHWYLYMLGVAPVHQRQGIGTRLLEHGLARADTAREPRPAYLESFNPQNLSFYYRQGFKQLETACTPNENGPRFWMLARQPKREEWAINQSQVIQAN